MMDKVHVHMFLHIASNKFTAGNKARLIPSPFLISTSWFCILSEAFRNDHVPTFSTALRSATKKNKMGGYVTVRVRPKRHSAGAQWIGLNSSDVTRLVTTEDIRIKYSLLE